LWKNTITNGDAVLSKDEVLRRIRENWERIEKFGVKRIGVFGSCARGEAKEKSDIDLLVEFKKGQKILKTS
jgi:hypothetical protein